MYEPCEMVSTSVVCLTCVRSQKLSEIGAKFCHLCRKSVEKTMTSNFAPEVAEYPKSILPQQQFRARASLLFRFVSNAACFSPVLCRSTTRTGMVIVTIMTRKTMTWAVPGSQFRSTVARSTSPLCRRNQSSTKNRS